MALNIPLIVFGCFAFAIQNTFTCDVPYYCPCMANVTEAIGNYTARVNAYLKVEKRFLKKLLPEIQTRLVTRVNDVTVLKMSHNASDYVDGLAQMFGLTMYNVTKFTPEWEAPGGPETSDRLNCVWLAEFNLAFCELAAKNKPKMHNITKWVQLFDKTYMDILTSSDRSFGCGY